MAFRLRFLVGFFILLLTIGSSKALVLEENLNPATSPKAISDLKEAIVKVLGLKADEFKISGFDLRDALVGRSIAYEFNIEIDNKVLPFKLLEDVNRWEYVDLPIFRAEDSSSSKSGEENGLIESRRSSEEPVLPILAPFQLAGPMELWIQDAKDMRLSLPHDVDAGVLKKVILADGAVVTVKGARSVSLRHPLDLPLPLNRTTTHGGEFASGLLTLAERLRHSAQTEGTPLVSLRIVGPTSLTSPSSSSSSSKSKLKLKRLAPGLVELSSPSKSKAIEAVPTISNEEEEAMTLLTPDRFTTMWPLTSINGSNSNLRGFEKLLYSVLGEKASEEGSIRLLKAEASAQTFVKMVFEVEKKWKEGDGFDLEGYPEWRTKPETVKMHFEVLARVDGQKVVPERVVPVNPVVVEDNIAPNVLMGNMTMSRTPIIHPPPNPFTL